MPIISDQTLNRRQVHSVVGEWLGHFPVAGWLRVVSALIQRQTATENVDWSEKISETTMELLREAQNKIIEQGDPVKGHWLVRRESPIKVWTDASSIALGVVLEIDNDIVEDASWLRPKNDSAHINLRELDAAIRGLNLALSWGKRIIMLITDSATVVGWLRAVIEGTHNVKTRSLSEMLIRRRLDTLKNFIEQENLEIKVQYVESAKNLADKLTRLPSKAMQKLDQPGLQTKFKHLYICKTCHIRRYSRNSLQMSFWRRSNIGNGA